MRAGNKSIELYSAQQAGAPLIILNTFDNEGAEVLEEVRKLTQADFSLVTVSGLSWDDDMTPWPHEGIMKGDTPYGGRADIYIAELEAILSQVGKELGTKPVWTGLAGYSLGGLFAIYAMYRTKLFSRIASASGSMWYPDFAEYAVSHEPPAKPERLYFSLGDKEAKTRNPILSRVEENTQALYEHYRAQGITTVFELNPGNHFKDNALRMAKGIAWLLKDQG